MTKTLDARQIFLASPTGLENERKVVRETIARYNRNYGFKQGIVFVDRGWEEVAPGTRRAQDLINGHLDNCDFQIVLFAERWGSPPGASHYTSGTEEEFMRAIAHLNDVEKSMRDIHVFFRTLSPAMLADPGPSLSKVLDFKKQLEASDKLLYGTFDSVDSLQTKVERSLVEWAENLTEKVPNLIEFGPLSAPGPELTSGMLEAAIAAASAGSTVQAEILFAKAVQTGDIEALVQNARFLRRRGLLEDAVQMNEKIVEALATRQNRGTDESVFLVGALANLGVIWRKRGNLTKSIDSLNEAIRVANASPLPLYSESAYAFDNLGHSLGQLGHHDKAREAFESAARRRDEQGDASGAFMSKTNIGWLELRTGDNRAALQMFESLAPLAESAGAKERANYLVGRGNALFRLEQSTEALPFLESALEINQTLKNSDGVSIASGLLARAHASLNDTAAARAAIERVLEESLQSGSVVGRATAYWSRALVNRAEGKSADAAVDFERAISAISGTKNQPLERAIQNSASSPQFS